jgi:hypothetical protein
MNDYHTRSAFDARMAKRRANPVAPLPLRCWYHCCCIGNWRDVVREHAAIFSALDLHPTACVLGDSEAVDYVRTIWPVAYHSTEAKEYETPTLQRLWEDCRANPTGAVLYCHTKGVSKPDDLAERGWRRMMDRFVVGDWRANLQKLAVADIVGANWQDSRDYPHFAGNFWMARADWIATLDSPDEHRGRGGPPIAGHPWARMHAEMWVGSKQWHHIESLACRNWLLWPMASAYDLLGEPRPEGYQ